MHAFPTSSGCVFQHQYISVDPTEQDLSSIHVGLVKETSYRSTICGFSPTIKFKSIGGGGGRCWRLPNTTVMHEFINYPPDIDWTQFSPSDKAHRCLSSWRQSSDLNMSNALQDLRIFMCGSRTLMPMHRNNPTNILMSTQTCWALVILTSSSKWRKWS